MNKTKMHNWRNREQSDTSRLRKREEPNKPQWKSSRATTGNHAGIAGELYEMIPKSLLEMVKGIRSSKLSTKTLGSLGPGMNCVGRYQLTRHRAVLKSLLKSTYSQLNYVNTIIKEFDDPEDRVLIKDAKKLLLVDFLNQLESLITEIVGKTPDLNKQINVPVVDTVVVETHEAPELAIDIPQLEIANSTVEVNNLNIASSTDVLVETDQITVTQPVEPPTVESSENAIGVEIATPSGTIELAKKNKKKKNKTKTTKPTEDIEPGAIDPPLELEQPTTSTNPQSLIAKYADLILSHQIKPYKEYTIEINTDTQQLRIDLRRLEEETDYLITRAEIEQYPDTPQQVYDALFTNTLKTLEMKSPIQVKIAQTIIKFISKVTDFNFSKLTDTRNYIEAMAWMQVNYRKYLSKTYGKDYVTVPAH